MSQRISCGVHYVELVFFVFLHFRVESLKITSLSVPSKTDPRYDEPELTCRYEFGAEGLYTVKWYKGEHEFYRYLPTYDPQIIQFPTDEVSLSEGGFVETKTTLEKRRASPEVCNTTACTIRLVNLTSDSGGEYSCEISSERPYFNTDIKSVNLTITALPNIHPAIEGITTRYSPGDIFSGICVSEPSFPISALTWLINGELAPPQAVGSTTEYAPPDRYGLKRARSEVHFRVEDEHFQGEYNQMYITCVNTMPGLDFRKASHVMFQIPRNLKMTLDNQKLEWSSSSNSKSTSAAVILIGVTLNMSIKLIR